MGTIVPSSDAIPPAASVAAIARYPVKGLSADPLDTVLLEAGRTLPGDRRFAIAQAPFDPDEGWRPKSHFATLVKVERLAGLATRYDEATTVLTITRAGRVVARGALATPVGRMVIEQFLAAFMTDGRRLPRIVEVPGVALTDCEQPVVSILNAASVRDLERVVQAPVDPRRFRANLLVEGWEPWAELGLAGRRLRIGAATLAVIEPITRCMATGVNPDTGARDLNIPQALKRGYGHCLCGVYARVEAGGRIGIGDPVAFMP